MITNEVTSVTYENVNDYKWGYIWIFSHTLDASVSCHSYAKIWFQKQYIY